MAIVRAVDTGELKTQAFRLASGAQVSPLAFEAVMRLSGQRIQSMARNSFAGTRYWKQVPRDITYEVNREGLKLELEVGRERGIGGQSALMHLLEYGSSRFGPIKPSLGPALDANVEPFAAQVVAAALVPLGAGIGKKGRVSR